MPVVLGLLALSTFAAGCAEESTTPPDETVDPMSWSIKEAGPYACGHRVVDLVYTNSLGTERTVPLHLWYPSNTAEGEHPKYRALFEDEYAWEDVPLAQSAYKGGFPILVHSHGYKGFAGNSHRMMCTFASHGYVAAAPEHVGNTIGDTPDPMPLSVYYNRLLDIRAALDWLAETPSEDPLAGKTDLTHVAMSGHSFGTYTAWGVAGATFDVAAVQADCDSGKVSPCTAEEIALFEGDLSESRAKLVIPMAGGKNGFYGQSGLNSAKVPVLLMTGSLDDVGAAKLFDEVSQVNLTWVDVEGGCHQLFGLGNNVLADSGCQVLADEDGFALVHPWELAFVRYHLFGDKTAEVVNLVEGVESISPLVTMKHKE